MTRHNSKKPPTAVAAARGQSTQPVVTDRRNATMFAYPQTVCQRPECDEFDNSHATSQGQPTHVIDLCPGARLEAIGEGPRALEVDAIKIRRPSAIKQFGAAVERAGKLTADLNAYTPAERISRNVRAYMCVLDHASNSTRVREILEVSVQRGRDLWAGRMPYADSEADLLAAYLGIEARDLARADRLPLDYEWTTEGRERARRRGEDRVVTLREERRELVAA